MKLARTIIYVKDVEQAAAFSERVFGFERGEVNSGGFYIALKTGETRAWRSFVASAVWPLTSRLRLSAASSSPWSSRQRLVSV
jgi:catechol 2,3-dioxygenase-like lactoylglutathione lyase family enzyme